jgi:hypothetical protein
MRKLLLGLIFSVYSINATSQGAHLFFFSSELKQNVVTDNFTNTALTSTSASFTWLNSRSLERATLANYSDATVIFTGGPGFTDTGLTANTTYYYRLASATLTIKTFSTAYQTLLNRGTTLTYTLPSASQQILQNALMNSLPSGIDVLWVTATDGDQDFATLNWITPASFQATRVSSPTFTKNQGYYGNGTSSYINTNWNPNTNGSNYLLNNSSIFCYVVNNSAGNNSMASMGVSATGIDIIIPRNVSNLIDFRININAAQSDTWAVTKSNGLKFVSRTTSTNTLLYDDGAIQTTVTRSSLSRPTNNLYLEALNNTGTAGFFSNRGIGMAGAGASLSGSETLLYTAWNTYRTSINTWGNLTLQMGSTTGTFND